MKADVGKGDEHLRLPPLNSQVSQLKQSEIVCMLRMCLWG